MARITETPWSRRAEELLADGEWHDGMQLLREVEKLITPGPARRKAQNKYVSRRRRENGEEEPERKRELPDSALIAMGKRYMTQNMVHGRLKSGAWQTDRPITAWRGRPGWQLRKVIRYSPHAIAKDRYGISPQQLRDLILRDPALPHIVNGRHLYVEHDQVAALDERVRQYKKESRARYSRARRAVLERGGGKAPERYSMTELQRKVHLSYRTLRTIMEQNPDFPFFRKPGATYVNVEDMPDFEKLVEEWKAGHKERFSEGARKRRAKMGTSEAVDVLAPAEDRAQLAESPTTEIPSFDSAGLTELYERYRAGEEDLRPQVMSEMRRAFHTAPEI